MSTQQQTVPETIDEAMAGMTPDEQILKVAPQDIRSLPELKALRVWGEAGALTKQQLSIPELARLIAEEGQTTPCQVYIDEEGAGGLVMIAGERRKAAVELLRAESPAHADLALKVQIWPGMNADRALRHTLMENIQHEDFTDMEKARATKVVRERFGWKGKGKTEKVALFMGLGVATVTELERLLLLPEDVQKDIQTGVLSKSAALDLVNAQQERQPEVLDRAKKKAQDEADKRAAREAAKEAKKEKGNEKGKGAGVVAAPDDATSTAAAGAGTGDKPTEAASAPAPAPVVAPSAKKAPKAKVKVTGKHIREATRELGAEVKIKAPKLSEVVDMVVRWVGPKWPKVMSAWAKSFVAYSKGKVKQRVVEEAWAGVATALTPELPLMFRTLGSKAGKSSIKPTHMAVSKAGQAAIDKMTEKKGKAAAKPKAKTAARKGKGRG